MMKKTVIIFMALAVLLNLSTFAQANELYDSVNIPLEEKELILSDERYAESNVIKIFEGHFMDKFADGWEILATAYVSEEIYMIHWMDSHMRDCLSFATIEDNALKRCAPTIYREGIFTVYEYMVYPELIFDSSVQVQNVFCLHDIHDLSMGDGLCIYYITAQGDYILYKMWSGAEEMYLFTAEEFYPLTEALIEIRQENLKYGAGWDMLDSVCDIEQYRFNPDQQSDDPKDEPNQDPQEPTQPSDHTAPTNPPSAPDDSTAPPIWILPVVICGSIVVVGAIAAVVLLKKRKSA